MFVTENMLKPSGPDGMSRSLSLLSQHRFAPEVVTKLRSSTTVSASYLPA